MTAVLHENINSIENLPTDLSKQPAIEVVKTILEKVTDVSECKEELCVSGKSIGDIPSSYKVPPLRRHEKIVVGTFIDAAIVPGFRYNVRRNGTTEFLFDGKCLYLESIGQGYGKRLTFESDDILNNDNFFWSDNSISGYAFSVCALQAGERFDVYENDLKAGFAEITTVADDQEIIKSYNDMDHKIHFKEVQVNFKCQFHLQNDFISDVAGLVVMKKHANQSRAVVKQITALLLPCGKICVLKPLL